MESAERLVRTWIASGRDEELVQTVSDISSGQSTLLNVVKALDKLEDIETVIPALKGLVPLTALPTFSNADAVDTIRALLSHVKMQTHNQSTRYLVYKTLDSIMARHRDALQGMSGEFLAGYAGLVDGEKDPRNLMLAFAIDRVICIEFDISQHIEDIFNITFCYFPITFRPPVDDPYGITPEDLKLALRSCLSASPLFGQLAIPLFLEKLLAGSPATKKDIIETMTSCIPVYGAAVARTFAKRLWNSLKLEVFQPVNSEIEKEALKATQILIQTIYGASTDAQGVPEQLEGLVMDICDECLELIGEPEKNQAVPASKVIAALIGTTPSITLFSLSQAITQLMKLFRDPDEVIHRPQILTLLCVIVGDLEAKWTMLDGHELRGQLLSFKDDVLGAFISGTKALNSREAALEGLKMLSQMQGVLNEEELVYMVHNINEILQSDNENILFSDDALSVLITIADRNSKIVEESTLPLLFSSLPDSPPSRDARIDRKGCWATLRCLSQLCISAPLFEILVIRLSTKLDLVCAPKGGGDDIQDNELRAAYAHGILKTLASVLELKVNAKHSDVPKYIDRLVPRLYNLFIYLALVGVNSPSLETDFRILNVAGQVITLVVQTLTIERQQRLARELHAAYFEGDVALLATGHQVMPTDSIFKPLEASSTSLQRNTVSLLAAAVIAFRKEVLIPEIEPSASLENFQTWSLYYVDNNIQRQAAHHIIASLLNKNTGKMKSFISKQIVTIWKEEVLDTSKPAEHRKHAIEGWLWIAKSLVILNHNSVTTMVNCLFKLFEDPEVGWDAARVAGEIARGDDNILTKQNHTVIRILYAQKYFNSVLPKILTSLRGPIQAPGQKANLVALTSLISSLPHATYISEMPTNHKLMPYLIRGLDLPDTGIRTNIINTLSTVAADGGEACTQEHANTLVSLMLKNILPQELTSVSLRAAALKYLAVLPRVVRYDILHPHKASVISKLGKALDDPKRAVRKEAVDTRSAWFLYNG
ncbi:hypothetical protein EW145_g1685 [Phellinidium pouzarii]|uniref:MMS19 nucleotide excision repair protein n=1 Tax=Phellinidium pouzarii TaxID=167371 RepID=A0A4S4LDL0_9AGAM|nr:hypothetical protein EW145_g1685 [Phellinidium pouzarii]